MATRTDTDANKLGCNTTGDTGPVVLVLDDIKTGTKVRGQFRMFEVTPADSTERVDGV